VASDLEQLSSKLGQQLRDTEHDTWNSIEKDDLITWAVRSLFPRYSRYLDPSLSAQSVTLVADTLFYSLPAGMLEVSTVDLIDTLGYEQGPLNGQAWQITGDPYSGSSKLRVAPQIVDNFVGGSLRLHGYGRYDIGRVRTGIALATSANADDIIDTATAHGLTIGNTVEFSSLTGGTGLVVDTTYWVIATSLASTSFRISASEGGTPLTFSSDITAGTVYQTHLIPDDFVPLVLAKARAEAYRRMGSDRVAFENWQARNQKQNVSINELLGLIQEAESEAIRQERAIQPVWRRPVPGRLG